MPHSRPQPVIQVLVLGVGNTLMADDGAGVAAVRDLAQEAGWPEGVRFMDIGTLGPRALPYLEGVRGLVVVDAVAGGNAPGTVVRVDGHALARQDRAGSAHDMGVADLLSQAAAVGWSPRRVVVIGVEPSRVALEGEQLSPEVRSRLGELKRMVREEIRTMLRIGSPRTAS